MSMHPVPINDEQIQATYAKYINEGVEGEYIANGEPEPNQEQCNPNAWIEESEFVTTAFFGRIAPNWNVPIEHQEGFASSLSAYLSKKWPQGFLNEKIENMTPGFRMLFEFGNCARHGFDVESFKFKPMQEQQAPQGENTETDERPEQTEKTNGKFTTDS